MQKLYEYLIDNANFIVDKNLNFFEGSGFVVGIEGYTIKVPSIMLNHELFQAIMETYRAHIEGELYIAAWLDETTLTFNFNISIIDENIDTALSKAEKQKEGSIRPLLFYRVSKINEKHKN